MGPFMKRGMSQHGEVAMRLPRIWILVVASLLFCGGVAAGARAERSIARGRNAVSAPPIVIVYGQEPGPAGGLAQSSLRDPEGSNTDQWVWDGFTLGREQAITEVRWRGGYDPAWLGSGGPVLGFTVAIYASIPSGGQPDLARPALVRHEVRNNANETPAAVLGGVQTYDYRYALPSPFQAAAGTKYWLQIEAFQAGAPDWGLAKAVGGDGHYFRRIAGEGPTYQLVAGDVAFTLLGPQIDGYRLFLPRVLCTASGIASAN